MNPFALPRGSRLGRLRTCIRISACRKALLLSCALAVLLFPLPSRSATIIWANVGTDFATGANWVGGNAPTNDTTTDIASFGTAATNNPSLAANRSVAGLVFANGAGSFTFSATGGSILTLGASGIVNNDNSTQTLDATLALALGANAAFSTASSGTLSIASAVDTAGNTLTLTSSGSTAGTLSGVISGTGAVTKTGTNTWTVSGLNTYTGITTVSAGVFSVTTLADGGSASGIGASDNSAANLVLDGGTLRFAGTTAQTSNRLFTLGLGGGTLDSSGSGSNTLGLTATGSLAFSGSGSRTLTLTGSNTGTNSLAAVIDDNGGATSVVKSSTGQWLMSAANTYTGSTTVTGGTLNAGNDAAFGTGTLVLNGGTLSANATRTLANDVSVTANSTIGGAAALTLSGAVTLSGSRTLTVSNSANTTISGAIGETGGSADFLKAGLGVLILSGTNTYTGQTSISAGTVSLSTLANADGTASALGAPTGAADGTIRLGSGVGTGTLIYTGSGNSSDRGFDLAGSIGGGGLTNNGSGTLTLSGNVSASVAGAKTLTLSGTQTGANTLSGIIADGSGTVAVSKSGTGNWTLSGANTFSGNTTVSAGTLLAGHDSAFGTGTLALAGGSLAGSGGTRTLANDIFLSFSTNLTGSENLVLNGNLTQSASTTLTISNSGTTALGNIALSNSGTNRTLTLNVTGGNTTISGAITNGGTSTASAVTKTGTGNLTLSGANTFGGILTVSAGTLRAENSAALGSSTAANAVTLGGGTLVLGANAATDFVQHVTVSANSNITSDRLAGGAGVTHALGNLTLGASVLTVAPGSLVTSGTAGLGFDQATFTGNGTLSVASGAQLSLGPISDNGATRALTKAGAGELVFTATPSAWSSATNSFTVTGGTATLSADSVFGTGSNTAVTIRDILGGTATLNLAGNDQSIGALTFGGTGGTATSINSLSTGSGVLTLGGTVTYNATGNPLGATLSGNVSLGAATRSFSIADSTGTAAELTVSAVVSGAVGVGLSKSGTGTLVLSGANTFDGPASVSAGILRAETNSAALGTGTLSVTGGTLQLAGNSGINFGRNTTLGGSATLSVDRVTAGSGVTHTLGTLSAGTFTLTVQAGGNITSGSAYGATFGASTITGNTTFTVANNGAGTGTLTLGALSASALRRITKLGDGTLVLADAAGTLTSGSDLWINAGTVRTDATNALGATPLFDIVINRTSAGTALLDLNGTNQSALTLTFGGTGANAAAVNNLSTGSGTLTLGGGVTYTSTNNPLGSTLSGNVDLGAATRTFSIADSTNTTAELTVSANLTSSGGGLTKTGTGNLILSGTNTQTGTTTVSAGTMTVSSGATLAAATANLTVNTGTLALNNSAQTVGAFSGNGTVSLATGHAFTVNQTTNTTFSGVLSGTDASLTKLGTGTLTLSGSNTFSGALSVGGGGISFATIGNVGAGASHLGAPTTIAHGTISLGNGTNSGSLTFTGTTGSSDRVINLAGTTGGAVLTANGNLTLTSAFTATGAGNKTLTLQGTSTGSTISGALVDHNAVNLTSLVKAGTGTWILSGANTYTGTTSIERGTLSVASLNRVTGGSASSSLGAPTTVANGTLSLGSTTLTGTLLYTGGGETTDRVINLAGTTGGGAITANGSAGLVFSSALTVTGAGNKTLTLQGTSTGNEFAGAIVNYDGLNLTSLTKAGTGTWTLSGANTFTGTTTVTEGTLRLSSSATAIPGALALGNGTGTATAQLLAAQQIASTSAVTFNSAGTPVLDLNGFSQTVGSLATTNTGATVALGSPGAATTFTFGDATDTTFAGIISGGSNAAVTKAGTGTTVLAGTSTYSGTTTVGTGVLSVQNNAALGSTAAGTTIASGAALHFNNAFSGNLTVGAEALTLNGTGVASDGALRNIAGNNSHSGAITFGSATRIDSVADTLTLSGSVSAGGFSLTVGGAGNVTLSSNLNLGSGTLTRTGSGTLTLNGATNTVGSTSITGGTLTLGAGDTLTSGAISSSAGTTLTIGSGGTVTADYAAGSTTFSGALAGSGTFTKNGAGTLVFDQTFTASSLTLVLGGGTLSLTGGAGITVGTLHITGNTILDFNSSAGTFLSSAALVIDPGVTVTVNNWISVSGTPGSSTAWYATSTINGSPLGVVDQVGGTPLNQIVFTSYTGLTTTWVSGSHSGWFDREIRPTPEPATTGALLVGSALALLLHRRRRHRRPSP